MMPSDLRRCPFCNGRGRLITKQLKYYSRNYYAIKARMGSYVRCNSCHARGPLIAEDMVIPYGVKKQIPEITDIQIRAIIGWNSMLRREAEPYD